MHKFEIQLSDEQIDRIMTLELITVRDYSDSAAEQLACEVLLDLFDADRKIRDQQV